MKRFLCVLSLSFLVSLSLFAVVEDKNKDVVKTSFTVSDTAFIGFSKRNVTSDVPVDAADKYPSGSKIVCVYDQSTDTYLSPTVYAYCQVYSKNSVSVKVTVPAKMSDPQGNTIEIQLVYPSTANKNTSRQWLENKTTGWPRKLISYYVELPDNTPPSTKSAVLMSQPIIRKVPGSAVNKKTTYSLDVTLEVTPK